MGRGVRRNDPPHHRMPPPRLTCRPQVVHTMQFTPLHDSLHRLGLGQDAEALKYNCVLHQAVRGGGEAPIPGANQY